jgi:signal peptidase I
MPLTQHTLPLFNCKSYIEWPQWEYRRVKGFGNVELGDIVVFNYPAGDTVAVNYGLDLYALCYERGLEIATEQGMELESPSKLNTEQQMRQYEKISALGRQFVDANRFQFGEVITRPVDRRENYVKRCVGLPGQTLEIKDKVIYVDGKAEPQPELVQFNYRVYTRGHQMISDEICADLGISDEDRDHLFDEYSGMPLTYPAKAALEKMTALIDSIVEIKDGYYGKLYPLDHEYGWTRDNYGPVWIPAKGKSVKLTMDNIALYERPIRAYEGNLLEVKNGKIYINGKESTSYTFKMDYYWMMGDNRHNSADSRYWGFVPEDHIVGKPLLIWLSISEDLNPKSSGIRWSRLFKYVGNIK